LTVCRLYASLNDMTPFQTRYYNFFTKLYNYKNRIKLQPVDFNKPWWTILWQQKAVIFTLVLTLGMINLYDSVMLVWIAQALEAQDLIRLIWIIGIRIFLIVLLGFTLNFNAILQMVCMQSVFYSANKLLLETDPIYHTTKSSGVIISKVNKGSAAYENILDVVTFEIYTLFISLFGTVIVLFHYNDKIGLVAAVMVIIFTLISVYWTSFNNKVFKPICIEAEDKLSEITVESMQQTAYIRSTFATTEQLVDIKSSIKTYAGKEATRWETDGLGYYVLRVLFFISVLTISIMILNEIQAKSISVATGLALITTYFISLSNIRNVGGQIKRLTESHSRITDLFEFMRTFGKQTFPVLDDKVITIKN
jgi:ABC-type transport system involved in Fe-S cluster assembly fused permease/ATPase subunit